ncbi:MAG: response regulator transcription factor [Bacteroidales bacterium]|nr:response regulator transcription factor [Bacteroidales bacterium]MDY0201931.1 response regulator transcription factor [Tenuifilaceae bacterium]
MKDIFKILIIEPSVIVREGIFKLIASIDYKIATTCVNSLSDAFELAGDEDFGMVVVNPVLFKINKNSFNKFSTHFKNTNQLGLISIYYDRSISTAFSDCIYLSDDKEAIINTISRYLKPQLDNNLSSDSILSERETEVLKLLANGKSHKEIADNLFISIHTVVTHRKNISTKLGIKSTAALVIYAVANNIINLNDSLKTSV